MRLAIILNLLLAGSTQGFLADHPSSHVRSWIMIDTPDSVLRDSALFAKKKGRSQGNGLSRPSAKGFSNESALFAKTKTQGKGFAKTKAPAKVEKTSNELFQRSLLAAQVAYQAKAKAASPVAATAPASSGPDESTQRALLATRFAAEAKAKAAVAAVAVEEETESVDISIPYDAAARLAYDASDKSMDYQDFKAKYEADAVAEVTAKQPKKEEGTAEAEAEAEGAVAAAEAALASVEEASAPAPPVAEPAPVPAPAVVEEPEKEQPEATMPKELAIVPVNEDTIQFTSGLIGGIIGLAIGGPIFATLLAAASNYASRKDTNEVSEIVQTVSKSSIQSYNYLYQVDAKYEFLGKTKKSLEAALDKLKKSEGVDPETVKKVEDALTKTTEKMASLNEEYDLASAASIALGTVGDLVEKAFDQLGSLNGGLIERLREFVDENEKKNK